MAPGEILSCPGLPGALQDPYDRTSGFGDMVYVGVVAPRKSVKIESTGGVFIWGVGATSMFPTASEDVLGAGRMVAIGQLPVNIHGEVDYSVIHPDDRPGSRWDARLYITAVIPTFVF